MIEGIEMKRQIYQELIAWKSELMPLPLLLRGARQVGKSYIIEKFGEQEFENFVTLNFEYHPEYAEFFETLVPDEIIQKIFLVLGHKIEKGKTLLFLDEIQECPNAIMALRYFKERMPGLHVIGAGSLLEFALNDENMRMPVGRVEFLRMRPLSFQEYLICLGREELVDFLKNVTIETGISNIIHKSLLQLVRQYMVLGGMPAVLQKFFETSDMQACQRIQTVLLNTYRADFGKYAKQIDHKQLQTVFRVTPGLVGQTIKYSRIDPEVRAEKLKKAIELLNLAGIIHPVYATTASGLPLNALINQKKFKLIYLDVGLTKRVSGLDADILLADDLLLVNQGAIAEQFVGQELLACGDPHDDNELFFWTREEKSTAEVDYVTTIGSQIMPIEVKAGSTGSLKSLHIFMEEKKLPLGVRISQQPLSITKNILSLPLYMISELDRLVRSCLVSKKEK